MAAADAAYWQVWRLDGTLEADGLKTWKFAVCIEWFKGTKEVRLTNAALV